MVVPGYNDSYTYEPVPTIDGNSSVFGTMDQGHKSVEDIEIAVKNVERFISIDNSFPDVGDKWKVAQGIPSRSGLQEQEYPICPEPLRSISQLKSISKIPIPNEIQDHISQIGAHCHSVMGTFSEIRRAWLVLDSDLFLWDYEFGTDVAFYDGVSEIIITAGLVKPKKDVFQDYVQYLLALATPTSIVVLGVTFDRTNDSFPTSEEMHITTEVVYKLSTDGVVFSTIVGTENGRIFLGAKDGCLYEFVYQKEISWWGKRCQKVNHSSSTFSSLVPGFLHVFSDVEELIQICVDSSRQVLYTLSAKGSIEVYDLGESGQSTSKVVSFKHTTILNTVVKITEQSVLSGPVISICAVPVHDSKLITLVAVMESGTRIYFAFTDGTRLSSLRILHVRIPPGYAGFHPLSRPKKVRTSICHRGTSLLVNSEEGCNDRLWCLSADLDPFSSVFVETLTVNPLDGMVWSLDEFGRNLMITSRNEPEPPLLITQHYENTTKYVCLTDQGSEIFQKLRPVDMLREILEQGHDAGSDAVRAFFETFTEDEICATFLLLACQKIGAKQVSNVATRGFFFFGGEPKLIPTPTIGPSPGSPFHQPLPTGFNPGMVSTPIGHQQVPSAVNADQQLTFQFSHKHNGLYIFLSRTMRPVWNARVICSIVVDEKTTEWIIPSLIIERAELVINHLAALIAFIECNPQVSDVPLLAAHPRVAVDESTFGTPTNRRRLQELYAEEKKSLQSLKYLAQRAYEVLNLWRILYDHQFRLVAASLSQEDLNYLSTSRFGDLILNGVELCNNLINRLLNSYLKDNSSVESISTKLRDVCPSLFLMEDAVCAKAIQMIAFSRKNMDPDEREKLLQDAVQALRGVCPKINLSAVCSQFLDAGYFAGIYELSELCAKKMDPKDLALKFYRDGGIAYSPEHMAYTRRLECYKQLTTALDHLYTRQASNQDDLDDSTFSSLPQRQPRQEQAGKFVDLCLCSADEVLHSTVYSWMMDRKLHGELVACSRPSLEFFLQRSPASHQFASSQLKELLWMFLERQGNHAAAAEVLYSLAKEDSDLIPLEKRIHYLSHSLVCMKSDKSGAVPHVGILYQEVEDTLQVAQIQLKIQKLLSASIATGGRSATQAVDSLNGKLYNLTELFENFADPYNLWEIQLDIIDCSNMPVPDSEMIPQLWQHIIEEELEKLVSTNPNDVMVYITKKIKSILRNVRQQSPVSAIEFLLCHLEMISCKLGASKNYVHSLMTDLGVPAQTITDLYERLYVVNSPGWEKAGDEYHIIAAIGSFADHLARNPSIPSSQKKQTALKLNDLITHCLNMLYSKTSNEHLTQLIRWLKVVQTRLSKL